MDINIINGIIRSILPAILAYAVGKGWISSNSVGDVTAGVVAVAAAVWSIYTNKASAVVASAATNSPVAVVAAVADTHPAVVVEAAAATPEVEKIVAPVLASSIPSSKVVAK